MFRKLLIAIITATTISGCISGDEFDNSYNGNLEALWKVVDEHYCFFEIAGNFPSDLGARRPCRGLRASL